VNRKEEIVCFPGATIFMVLFFFFAVFFVGKVSGSRGFSQQHEQVSVFQVHPINAESILVSSAPSVQVCLELAVKFDVSLSSSRLVEIADSQRAVRCIFAAQQLELNNISPRDIRFYYHLFAANSRELPALS